jgi:hypothetical protein
VRFPFSLFRWLMADGWFVLREEYCWLVAGGWFVLREKYCWLVAGIHDFALQHIRRFSVANDVFAHVGATCSIWQITVEFFVSAASLLCHPSRRMNVLHEQRRIT